MTSLGMLNWLQSRRRKAALTLFFVIIYCVMTYFVSISLTRSRFLHSPKETTATTGTAADRTLKLELDETSLLRSDNSSRLAPPHGEGEGEGGEGEGGEEWEGGGPPVLILKGGRLPRQGKASPQGRTTHQVVAVPLREKAWRQLIAVLKEAETIQFPWKLPKVRRVDCRKLFEGDPKELEKANRLEVDNTHTKMADQTVASLASQCPTFKKMFTFVTHWLTEEERNFPIAYSLLVFKDAEEVLNLLRAIYRPQNYYCVHVDSKSDNHFRQAIRAMVDCFPNVFLSSRSVDVQWGTYTVLEPEIICMEDLWRYKRWKYFINLTGQEFPLKTNYELVKILKAYHGANNLEGTRKRANKERFKGRSPPGGIVPTKGSVHVVVNRDFVDFVLHTSLAQHFLHWARHVDVPDEVFFSSINHNPHLGIRGTYRGEPETHPSSYPFVTRFKNWGKFPCASGKRVRMICILSSGDLALLASRPGLFANKFYPQRSNVALDCLAERLFNRTRDRFLGHVTGDFNVTSYARMPFVTNMVNESTFERDLEIIVPTPTGNPLPIPTPFRTLRPEPRLRQ